MTLVLANPAGTKLHIKSVPDTVTFLNDEKNKSLNILVLINTVRDAFELTKNVKEIRSINFGGIRARADAKLISNAVAITTEDVILIKELLQSDIELEIRQVPTDEKQNVSALIPA